MRNHRWLGLVLGAVLLLGARGHAADYVTYEEITVANTAIGITATILTPLGQPQMTACSGKVLTAEINFRFDGVAPTASVGIPLSPGDWITINNPQDAARIKFIRTGSTSGVVRIHCWR